MTERTSGAVGGALGAPRSGPDQTSDAASGMGGGTRPDASPTRGKGIARKHRDSAGLNVDYRAQRGLESQISFDKFRVQVPLILGSVALMQIALSFAILGEAGNGWTINSIVFTLAANTLSLLNYRSMRLFPGTRRYAFILQAYLLPYLVMAGLVLWFRPAYSIPLLALGFGAAITLTWVMNVLFRRPNIQPLLIIPSPRTDELLAEMPRLYHRICTSPEATEEGNSLVVDLHADLAPEWERAIARAALRGAAVYHVKQVSESLTGRVRIDHLSENSFGMLRPNRFYFGVKDIADKIIAAAVLLALAPVLILAAIAVRMDTPGPAIFRQKRVGFRGEVFTIYKLRTMIQRQAPRNAREDAITRPHDPRVTRVGRFLRRSRIDELPQLFNVIKGELSLIGPRPEAEALSAWYEEELDFYPYRHVVKPGITGWAQVNQGHVASPTDVYRKLQYDFYYVKNFSLWLDLLIAFSTIQVMFTGRGSR